ncbi:MAG: Type 1 glutamine amidotransferase-like domain-containing protein [Nanoarchaeota archaeon]|nr:Type 1 glutamine amidotransferase-like domain-containing protein [Nanoarchaeota archaeon]
MATLLLTSGGIVPEIREYFLSILPKRRPEKNGVAFVTTAAYGESKNPAWIEKDRQLLYNCGIKHIEDVDLKDKTQKDVEKILSNKEIIFVNGGNTFYLLKWVRESGFDKLLPGFLRRGGLYVGVSAGSYIACPTIEAATWKHQDRNRVGITDFTALNLVPFLITAHFEEKYRAIVAKAAKTTKSPIVALSDKQAVLVQNGTVKVVGEGKREYFKGFKER